MTDDLIKWLNACIDDDERQANGVYKAKAGSPTISSRHHPDCVEVSVAGGPWHSMSEAAFIEEFYEPNPDQRLLREVESKRRIIELVIGAYAGYAVLPLLALPYSDRPGYREEWKP